ncbi:formate dehydrogenase subunit delta [Sphingobium sp. YR768]|uniref:formate dehydrogenase subunit delta n=1 Tax=Sphingobium sp. YR768 TaxID=1884365 RepID=UPI0008C1CF81|nr:formate dehydrogenase subunit delta [Sphingobium sp. YR768]SEQ92761.1 formate dehydrogenase subunit delta [Sphingobium sp. YR768]
MSDDTHVMSTTDRLVYMAHQIARNMAMMGEAKATEALAEHLTRFWDPRMKAQIIAIAQDQPERLSPVVTAAVARMAQGRPAPQVDAAQFNRVDEAGHCDAG